MEKTTEPNAPLSWHPRHGWSNASSASVQLGRAAVSGADSPDRAPAIPMEGAVLYHKSIDNSSVRYRHDPRDRDALRTQISWGLFVVLMLLVLSGPRLSVRHSGYRQAQLNERIETLIAVREHLKVEKGQLEDLRRIAALAARRGMRETGEGSYVFPERRPLGAEQETAVAQLLRNQQ